MKSFNCGQTIAILLSGQKHYSNFLKIEIANKQFIYKSYTYIHLTVCKQITDTK